MLQISARRFPQTRLRRTRLKPWSRNLVAENYLTVNDLIMPFFVLEGQKKRIPLQNLPGQFRYSIDELLLELKNVVGLGIQAIILFASLETDRKDENGKEAINGDNVICQAIRQIKAQYPDLGIFADVALDCYTDHGHDGLFDGHDVMNDETNEVLSIMAVNLAKAGADVIAPSDMMDGRIGMIRKSLDLHGFDNVQITSYAAKYASSLYSPFREAVNSMSHLNKKDKKSYQMDYRNVDEAMHEVALDLEEGADSVIVKPGTLYLDVVRAVKENFRVPVLAYHVSGEYAMLKAADQAGYLDYNKVILETLMAFKRAGADVILTYAACDVARMLRNTP